MIYFIILMVLAVTIFISLNNYWEGTTAFSMVLLVCWVLCGIGAHLFHVDNLATVETQSQIVAIQADKLERLKTSLGMLEAKSVALLNADTPMAKLIEEVALAEKSLADAKIELVAAKRSIIAREKSIFGFVV